MQAKRGAEAVRVCVLLSLIYAVSLRCTSYHNKLSLPVCAACMCGVCTECVRVCVQGESVNKHLSTMRTVEPEPKPAPKPLRALQISHDELEFNAKAF